MLTSEEGVEKRKIFPRSLADKLGVVGFVIGGHITLIYELSIAAYYGDSAPVSYYVHAFVCIFVYIQIYSNYYILLSNDVQAQKRLTLPSVLKPSWRYCPICQLNGPPRSWHCRVCDRCIFRRDHHCFFAGTCVGHFTYRRYLVILGYATFTVFYCQMYNLSFTIEYLNTTWWPLAVIAIFAPHISWLIFGLNGGKNVVSICTNVAVSVSALTLWLSALQIMQIFHGQTKHEHKHRDRTYDLGLTANIREVLGDRYFLVWFYPWTTSKLPSDGTSFQTKNISESLKSM